MGNILNPSNLGVGEVYTITQGGNTTTGIGNSWATNYRGALVLEDGTLSTGDFDDYCLFCHTADYVAGSGIEQTITKYNFENNGHFFGQPVTKQSDQAGNSGYVIETDGIQGNSADNVGGIGTQSDWRRMTTLYYQYNVPSTVMQYKVNPVSYNVDESIYMAGRMHFGSGGGYKRIYINQLDATSVPSPAVGINWGATNILDRNVPTALSSPINPGSGYSNATYVETEGGSGRMLRVDITTSGGGVTGVSISVAGGDGYEVGDIITIKGGDENATFSITAIDPGINGGVAGNGFFRPDVGENSDNCDEWWFKVTSLDKNSSLAPYTGEKAWVLCKINGSDSSNGNAFRYHPTSTSGVPYRYMWGYEVLATNMNLSSSGSVVNTDLYDEDGDGNLSNNNVQIEWFKPENTTDGNTLNFFWTKHADHNGGYMLSTQKIIDGSWTHITKRFHTDDGVYTRTGGGGFHNLTQTIYPNIPYYVWGWNDGTNPYMKIINNPNFCVGCTIPGIY